ncbi:2TM domain-containing protein [Thalassotalea ganghwensis]
MNKSKRILRCLNKEEILIRGIILLTPQYYWVLWCIGGWGIGVLLHYVYIVKSPDIFGKDWQDKQLAKRKNK